jgi:hypothetical protein
VTGWFLVQSFNPIFTAKTQRRKVCYQLSAISPQNY